MVTKRSFPKLDFSFMEPYALQREIMQHPARFKVVAFGRQSGKSWLAKRILLEKASNEGKKCVWVSPTIPTALEHWDDLLDLIEDSQIPILSRNKSTKTIKFLSGGSIRIRSAEIPKNLRGGTLDYLVLDEAAFMPSEVWYSVLQPTITASRGSVLFLSTPFGQNWFYNLFQLGQGTDFPLFKSWTMKSTDAPYQDHETLEIIRQTIPSLVWREEYLAEFLADAGGVFAGIDKVEYFAPYDKPLTNHTYVAGIDIGLDNDSSVFTVADKYSGQQVYGERFTTIGTDEQVDRFEELIKLWMPEVTHIEMNGIGRPLFKIIKKRLTKAASEIDTLDNEYTVLGIGGSRARIKGVWLTNAKKRKLIERVAGAIEYGRFKPLVRQNPTDVTSYGAIQMSEMSTFRRKKTDSGLEVAYGAAEGSHDDTVMALAHMYAGIEGDVEDTLEPTKKKRTNKTGKKNPFDRRGKSGKAHAPAGSMSRKYRRER